MIRKVVSMRVFVLCVVCLLSTNYQANAQERWNDGQHLGYNIMISGLVGGIGGMINKNEKQNLWEAFYTNFLKGGLGGGVIYAAKRTLPMVANNFDNALGYWCNRALLNLGNSMVYNSSLNRGMFESYYLELYGVNMRFKMKDEFEFSAKISSASTLMMLFNLVALGGIWDIGKSLKYGVYYFDMSKKMMDMTKSGGKEPHSGFAMRNMIYLDPKLDPADYKGILVHELIHTYQFIDFSSFRNALNPVGEKYIFTEDSWMSKISRYVYFDLPIVFLPFSFLQDYESSSVEGEANFYMGKVIK